MKTAVASCQLSVASALIGAGVLMLGGVGCSGGAARAASASVTGSDAPKASYFTVPANQMENLKIAAVEQVTWPRVLRLTGNVEFDQLATTPVISPVGGPVSRILVKPGDHVTAGQALLEVASPDFAQARDAYLKARDAAALAKKTYQRDQDLYDHQALAQAEVEAAETALSQAQADVNQAEQGLRILGFADPAKAVAESTSAEIAVRAPATGEVVERDINPGQLVQAGTTQCFVISDTSRVWVMANVFQSDLPYVHVGDAVKIETDASAKPFHGRIQYLSPGLDATTRTLQARIETANPGGLLKRQMYVTAEVQAGQTRGLVVPDTAVLRDDQNFPFVYVQVAGHDHQFERRPVTLGASQEGETQIASGLRAGEKVAGNGALFLQFANSFSN